MIGICDGMGMAGACTDNDSDTIVTAAPSRSQRYTYQVCTVEFVFRVWESRTAVGGLFETIISIFEKSASMSMKIEQ